MAANQSTFYEPRDHLPSSVRDDDCRRREEEIERRKRYQAKAKKVASGLRTTLEQQMNGNLTRAEIAVLARLLRRDISAAARKQATFWLGQKGLAKTLGCSERTVTRSISTFKNADILTVARYAKGGRNRNKGIGLSTEFITGNLHNLVEQLAVLGYRLPNGLRSEVEELAQWAHERINPPAVMTENAPRSPTSSVLKTETHTETKCLGSVTDVCKKESKPRRLSGGGASIVSGSLPSQELSKSPVSKSRKVIWSSDKSRQGGGNLAIGDQHNHSGKEKEKRADAAVLSDGRQASFPAMLRPTRAEPVGFAKAIRTKGADTIAASGSFEIGDFLAAGRSAAKSKHEVEMTKSQNTSHAVMAQRVEAIDSLDDFPTPPWATRALIEHVIEQETGVKNMTALEPACGRGYMSQAMREYLAKVDATDIHDYGHGEVSDFLTHDYPADTYDWVITNPPFRLAEEFIQHALPLARRGVAVLVRTVFIESVGRYNRIFSVNPPTKVAQFAERVPMVKGRLDRKASTATGYAWVVWEKNIETSPQLVWIPPCRKSLEKLEDYEDDFLNPKQIPLLLKGDVAIVRH